MSTKQTPNEVEEVKDLEQVEEVQDLTEAPEEIKEAVEEGRGSYLCGLRRSYVRYEFYVGCSRAAG